jgi:exodeoxyribonuclease VII small subunit
MATKKVVNNIPSSKTPEPSYQESIKELERIVQSLEQGDLDLGEISEKVKKATKILLRCRKELRIIEENINTIMGDAGQ